MRYMLFIAVIILPFARPTMCRAYDHATIIGDFYNYQFCDSCDHNLYRHEEGMYQIPHFNVGNGEAGVVLFSFPEELKPFGRVQLQLAVNPTHFYPTPTVDWSVYGFDGVIGNVGPADLAHSIPVASTYSVSPFEYYVSVDVTEFLQAAKHSDLSFAITGNSTFWTMTYPQLLVFPVPEPDSLRMFVTALGAVICIRRRLLAQRA